MHHPITRRQILRLGASLSAFGGVRAEGNAQAPQKGRLRALLVGVQGYARPHDKHGPNEKDPPPELHTLADVELLSDVLTGIGFDSILKLNTKSLTTKRSILSALKQFLSTTQDGDVLYFHFSGHGVQILDGKDYLRRDQALAPQDYVSGKPDSFIRDKELADMLHNGLEGTKPAAFLLTFDCCYSGTITRGDGAVARFFDADSAEARPPRLFGEAHRWSDRVGLIPSELVAKQRFTVISACRSDQKATEIPVDAHNLPQRLFPNGIPDRYYIGALSYAVAIALATVGRRATYRDLIERIADTMSAHGLDQRPVIEGLVDVAFLGGACRVPANYFLVKHTNSADFLQAGRLVGLDVGSQMNLFKAGTTDFKATAHFAKARITKAGSTESLLSITPTQGISSAVLANNLSAARAVIMRRVFTERPMVVDLSLIRSTQFYELIKPSLHDLESTGIVALTERGSGWDVQITPTRLAFGGQIVRAERNGGEHSWKLNIRQPGSREERTFVLNGANPAREETVSVIRRGGTPLTMEIAGTAPSMYWQALGEVGDTSSIAETISLALQRESRRLLLSQLTSKGAPGVLPIEIRLVRCEAEPAGVDSSGKPVYRWLKDSAEMAPGTRGIAATVGDFFRVELRNRNGFPLYVSLLDLAADGSLAPLWPHPKLSDGRVVGFDNAVPKESGWLPLLDSRKEHALYAWTEPIGAELILAIATRAKFNFAPLMDETIARSRAVDNVPEVNSPLGRLLRSATIRDASARGDLDENWHATSLHIELVSAS